MFRYFARNRSRLLVAKQVLSLIAGTAVLMTATEALAGISRDEALGAFKEAQTIYAKTCTASDHETPPPVPPQTELRSGRALSTAQGVLTKGDDQALLDALIAYIDASDCRPSNAPAWTLGAIFHQRPDLLQATIAVLPDKPRCTLVRELDRGWRFEKRDHKNDLDADLEIDRDARLTKLKASAPAECADSETN